MAAERPSPQSGELSHSKQGGAGFFAGRQSIDRILGHERQNREREDLKGGAKDYEWYQPAVISLTCIRNIYRARRPLRLRCGTADPSEEQVEEDAEDEDDYREGDERAAPAAKQVGDPDGEERAQEVA